MTANELATIEDFDKWYLEELMERHNIQHNDATFDYQDRTIRIAAHPTTPAPQMLALINALEVFIATDYRVGCQFAEGVLYRKRSNKARFELYLPKEDWKYLPVFGRYLIEQELSAAQLGELDENGMTHYDRICEEIADDIQWDIADLAPLWWQSEGELSFCSTEALSQLTLEAEELQAYLLLKGNRFDPDDAIERLQRVQILLQDNYLPLETRVEATLNELFDELELPNRQNRKLLNQLANTFCQQIAAIAI